MSDLTKVTAERAENGGWVVGCYGDVLGAFTDAEGMLAFLQKELAPAAACVCGDPECQFPEYKRRQQEAANAEA
jgi:hypothetical protein